MPSIYSNHLLDNDNNYQRAKPLNDNGILPYDSNLDYSQANGTLVKGSDNNVYQAMQDNGPSSAVVDPVGDNSGVWELAYFSPKNPQPKNYIVNSDTVVSQENGGSLTSIPNNTNFYVADEIIARHESTAGGSFTTEAGVLDGSPSRKITVTSATTNITGSSNAGRVEIRMESGNVFTLNNGNVTWSKKLLTNFTGILSLAFRSQGLNRSYVTEINVQAGVVKTHTVTLPFEADTISNAGNDIGIRLYFAFDNNGINETSVLDQWQNGDFRTSTNATNWTTSAGNYIEFAEIGLYEGNVAPKYQPYTDPVYNSDRYFYRVPNDSAGVGAIGNGNRININTFLIDVNFPQKMRQEPTLSGTTSSGFKIDELSVKTVTSYGLSGATSSAIGRMLVSIVGTSSTDAAALRYDSNSANLFWNARL